MDHEFDAKILDSSKVAKKLRDGSVCLRCCLRYCGCEDMDMYQRHNLIKSFPILSTCCSNTNNEDEKRVCPACCGILDMIDSPDFAKDILDKIDSPDGHEFSNYSLELSLPTSCIVFARSLWYYTSSLCLECDECLPIEDIKQVIGIKSVVKWILGPIISQTYGLTFVRNSDFRMQLTFEHIDSKKDCGFVRRFFHNFVSEAEYRKYDEERIFSQSNVQKVVTKISEEQFRTYVEVPPLPLKTLATYSFEFHHASVYVSGRYRKFSRFFSQTPWLLADDSVPGGGKILGSVENEIVPVLKRHFLCENCIFSASGREDVDVRMLGNGRPFAIEIVNPRKIFFTRENFQMIQDEINEKALKVDGFPQIQIMHLQSVKTVDEIRNGETFKRKKYRCIIWTERMICQDDLDNICRHVGNPLVLHQKTPIRVLHRRCLKTRDRAVYNISATLIPYNVADSCSVGEKNCKSHFFSLNLETQAGTYVKEFVHGDLGRTDPSLSSLLGCPSDLLQLDVLGVELDFPPFIESLPIPVGVEDITCHLDEVFESNEIP